MSAVILLLITGVGLGALYFLVASGLSLIYGLMGVLNFAHGSFLTLSGFLGWRRRPTRSPFVVVGQGNAIVPPRAEAAPFWQQIEIYLRLFGILCRI